MIEEIRGPLEAIYGGVPGAVVASVMGFDGLPVDTLSMEDDDSELDVPSLLVEYSSLLGQVQKSAQMFSAGDLEELSIRSEHLTMIIRPINEAYFVALALGPGASFGKGRYLLRIHAPKLAGVLS